MGVGGVGKAWYRERVTGISSSVWLGLEEVGAEALGA